MKKHCTVGVVGCGYWGPNLVRNFKNLPNCNVKAMCDVSESRLKHMRSVHPDVEGTSDYGHMLNGIGLDAVVVAAPVKYHYPLAKAALLAGKHTLIEKPMASSTAQCEELIEIAERMGLVLMTGHTFLYSAPVRKIAEIIQAGDIGEIRYINARRLNLGLFQKDINVAWDLAPHDISIILHILGEYPTTVHCQGNAHVTPGIEDVTNISLSFRNNRFATIQSSWLEPRKVREMTIVGSRRMIVYDDLHDGGHPHLRCPGGAAAALRYVRRLPIFLSLRRQLHPAPPPRGAVEDRVPAFPRLHSKWDDVADQRAKGTRCRADS